MPCDPSRYDSDAGDEGPYCGAFCRALPILREPAAASESGEGAFDDAASRHDLLALSGARTLDDLQGPAALAFERHTQFLAAKAAVGNDVTQPGEPMANRLQKVRGAVPVLNVGRVDDHEQHQALRVGQDMPLAEPLIFLPRSHCLSRWRTRGNG